MEQERLTPERLRSAWRVVTWAGLLGSIYYILCIHGVPRIKYLTELDATALDFGLIAGLSAFALVFQILGSLLSNRLTHRKGVWMALTLTHRLVFLFVLAAPLLFLENRYRVIWIIGVLFLHDVVAQTSVPLWLSWMADLVPRETVGRHWASRQRFITAANILVMVIIAVIFLYFEKTGQVILGFTLLAVVGVALGVADILLFKYVPEPASESIPAAKTLETLLQPLRDREFRPFLYYMAYWHLAVMTAAPFFGLYMIDFLELSVFTVQLLGAVSALGVAFSSRIWGLLCDTYGFRPVLQLLSVLKILTPLSFALAPQAPHLGVPFLVVVMFLDGIMNSGLMLALQGVLLKYTPRRNRTMYIASANFLSVGIMAGIGPVMAGWGIDVLNRMGEIEWYAYTFTGYHGIFMVSVVLRFAATFLARSIREETAVSLRTMLRQTLAPATLGASRLVYVLNEAQTPARRLRAARRLGELRHPIAIGELIHALRDADHRVREAAADALGEIGAADASEPLAAALFDEGSGIQERAARALGRIGGADSLKALLRNLRTQQRPALIQTVNSLGQMGNDAAILPLIALFHDNTDEGIREQIARALGRLSKTEDIEEVVFMLHGRRPLGQERIK